MTRRLDTLSAWDSGLRSNLRTTTDPREFWDNSSHLQSQRSEWFLSAHRLTVKTGSMVERRRYQLGEGNEATVNTQFSQKKACFHQAPQSPEKTSVSWKGWVERGGGMTTSSAETIILMWVRRKVQCIINRKERQNGKEENISIKKYIWIHSLICDDAAKKLPWSIKGAIRWIINDFSFFPQTLWCVLASNFRGNHIRRLCALLVSKVIKLSELHDG